MDLHRSAGHGVRRVLEGAPADDAGVILPLRVEVVCNPGRHARIGAGTSSF